MCANIQIFFECVNMAANFKISFKYAKYRHKFSNNHSNNRIMAQILKSFVGLMILFF